MKVNTYEIKQDKNGRDYIKCILEDGSSVNAFGADGTNILSQLEAGTKPDVTVEKDGKFQKLVAIAGVVSTPRKDRSAIANAMERKEAGIERYTDKKESSIKYSAIRRDAALFASSIHSKDELIENYEFWFKFFTGKYSE